MPKQNDYRTDDASRHDDGPAWTENGVELIISESDREQLEDFGIQNLLDATETVLSIAAAMRRRDAVDAATAKHALGAATHITKWMNDVQRELLLSRWLTHGEAAIALGVSRSTAQKRRESSAIADRELSTAYSRTSSNRPEGVSPADWFRRSDSDAPAPLSVLVPGGDLPVHVETNEDGSRTITTQARVLIVNGERLVVRPGQVREAQGFRFYGSNEGIEGYELPTPTVPKEYWNNMRREVSTGKVWGLTDATGSAITTLGGSFEVAGRLLTFKVYGRNEFVSDSRTITVNGESKTLAPNQVYEIGGYMITTYTDGLHGYENDNPAPGRMSDSGRQGVREAYERSQKNLES